MACRARAAPQGVSGRRVREAAPSLFAATRQRRLSSASGGQILTGAPGPGAKKVGDLCLVQVRVLPTGPNS